MIRRMFRYGGLVLFLAVLCYVAVDSYAEPFQTTLTNQYDTIEFLHEDSSGIRTYQFTSSPPRINNNGVWQDYILTETANSVKLETANSGSFIFNKDFCSYNLFNAGTITDPNSAKINDISWTVKGKAATSSTWSNVNSINNASCSVTVQTTQSTVKLIGQKSSSAGIFQIVLDYSPGMGIKETFRAYNNNPAWTNHNIGFTETFQVPQIIHFGKNVYDLSQYNNTVLNREWIENNEAKLVRLSDKIIYDFGVGFDNLNDIKITYIDGVAKLSLNYLYPTQIVPYQTWFEVDPTFSNIETSWTVVRNSAAGNGNSNCNADTPDKFTTDGKFVAESANTNPGGRCAGLIVEYNISSVGNAITVTDSDWSINVGGSSNPNNCNIYEIANTVSSSAAVLYPDMTDGTQFVNNNNFCTGGTGVKTIDLGTSADDALESTASGDDLFTFALTFTPWTRDGTSRQIDTITSATLSFTYTVPGPPTAPTNMNAESVLTKTYYSWSQSNGTYTDYFLVGRSLDNVTWPQSQKINVGNVTSYLDSSPYCTPGATCYVNVTASNSLYNSTSSYASYVMDRPPYAITDLAVTGVTPSTITVSFTPPNFHGHTLIGYQVNYTTPHGTPTIIYVNTTSSTSVTLSGLSSFTPYSIRVGAITDGGRNATGNIVDTQTLHPEPTFPITWVTATNPILIDTDDDGIIDTGYSANTTTSNIIQFTKLFGTGLSTITKTFSITSGLGTTAYFGVLDSDNFIVSFSATTASPTTCSTTMNFVNIHTGSVQTPITITRAASGATALCVLDHPVVMGRTDNQFLTWGYTSSNLVDSYNLYRNGTNQVVTSTSAGGATITPFGVDVVGNTNIYLPDTTTGTGSLNGTYGQVYFDSATNQYHNFGMGQFSYAVDKNVTQWNIGLKKEHQASLLTLDDPLWSEILGSIIQDDIPEDEEIYYLHYKILNPSLTSEPIKTVIDIDGTEHIALVSSNTLYYSRIPDISSYDFTAWLYDTYLPEIGNNAASEFPPQTTIRVVSPTTTYDVSGYGIQGFLTDYRFEIPGIDRAFYPEVINDSQVQPAILPPSSGLTAVSIHVRNAPQDAVVKFVNPTFQLFSEFYQWSAKPLQADDTASIDLPTNSCFNVYVSPDTIPRDWEDLGLLCASGTMPKQLTYLTGLSFTFWTLEWGVSTDYDADDDMLDTFVRNEATPYAYWIRIYDRNGTAQVTQLFSNVTGLNEQQFNVSSIQKPARVEILDITNRTLYHASLGYGNWLSDFQSFSNQHLTIDGFNLIFMMPLIFAAMWTRNTVSIGTMMTVVMIMVLVFMGVLAIPEMILYMMVFIAAIGMVAYKLLY